MAPCQSANAMEHKVPKTPRQLCSNWKWQVLPILFFFLVSVAVLLGVYRLRTNGDGGVNEARHSDKPSPFHVTKSGYFEEKKIVKHICKISKIFFMDLQKIVQVIMTFTVYFLNVFSSSISIL